MKPPIHVVPLALLLGSSLLAAPYTQASTPHSRAMQEKKEALTFAATITSGPDQGKSIEGKLQLNVRAGGILTGTLIESKGQTAFSAGMAPKSTSRQEKTEGKIEVRGQYSNGAVLLIFQLDSSHTLFGIGSAQGLDSDIRASVMNRPVYAPAVTGLHAGTQIRIRMQGPFVGGMSGSDSGKWTAHSGM